MIDYCSDSGLKIGFEAFKYAVSVCCVLIRLSDRNIDKLIRQPSLVYEFLGCPEVASQPSGSFLARFFGRTKPTPPPTEPPTLPESREKDDEGDVDKAWQAIHYLLTGTVKQTDSLMGFLCSGGSTIKGADVGYGPPRAYTSHEVASIVAELSGHERETLRLRYKSKEMDKQGVYPKIWARDGDDGYNYIWHHFERLRALLAEAHNRKQGLLIYYT